MASMLNEETCKRIEEYCRKISVAHNLDPEIQRELAGHMEDKVSAYLSGEESLTENDAFILARERFGDPALIKEMLGGVHAGAASVSLARRLMAIMLLTEALTHGEKLFTFAVIMLIRSFGDGDTLDHFIRLQFHPVYLIGVSGIAFLILFRLLKHWRRMAESVRSPWFNRWPAWSMVASIVALYAATPLIELAQGCFTIPPSHDSQFAMSGMIAFLALILMMAIATALLWCWWCDSAPRRPGAMRQVTLWYAFFLCWDSASRHFIEKIPIRSGDQFVSGEIMRRNGWIFHWSTPALGDAPGYAILLVVSIGLAVLGWLIHEVIRKKHAGPNSGNINSMNRPG